ncbi:MAG: MBL fold metallo-hydrolase, partial [Nanoarchaeota archaeon]|nr:MBL fold metallo-hydrolase [Nanoarchaeota archaeon]
NIMAERLSDNVWKINVDSNIYVVEGYTVIDTGPRMYRQDVINEFSKITDVNKIKRVIFTHLHYDHMGNFDLFPNAEFFASEQEISDFNLDPLGATVGLDPLLLARFKKIKLQPISGEGFEIIGTPGHTKGSICLFYAKDKILFTGDTRFEEGYGRLDLPTSSPEDMPSSLDKIEKIDYRILAPGHDY